jgi:FMN phosphatase YigB (HAD superfamily)
VSRPPEPWLVVDVDDTLVDTAGTGRLKCEEAARRLGLPSAAPGRFEELYGLVPFRECVALLHAGVDVDEFAATYDGLVDWAPDESLGDVRGALDAAASAGFRLGILTNGPADKTRRKLLSLKLTEDDFDFVRHADNGPAPKPAAEAFLSLQRDFRIDPRVSWYVSDQGADWRAAARAGFGAIGVVTGRVATRSRGTVPHLMVSRLDRLIDCLPGLAAARRPAELTPARHVGLDAGFTLIEHVQAPSQLLAKALDTIGVAIGEHLICTLFDSTVPDDWSAKDVWADDELAESALLTLYHAVLREALVDTGAYIDEPERDRITRAVVRDYTAPVNWRPVEGATQALRRFREAGKAVGVFSNWRSDLPEALAAAGLSTHLDACCSSALHGAAKPHTDAFAVLAHALEADDMSSIVYCGDNPAADIGGALAAGCRAALIDQNWDNQAIREITQVIVS